MSSAASEDIGTSFPACCSMVGVTASKYDIYFGE